MAAASLLLVAIAAASPEVALSVRSIGFDAKRAAAIEAAVERELADNDLEARRVPKTVTSGCFDDPDCVSVLGEGERPVLDVEIVRVGPLVQIGIRLFDPSGQLVANEEHTADASGFPGAAPLIDPELLESAKVFAPAASSATIVDVPPAEAPKAPRALPVLGYTGIGLIGVGAVLGIGGGALALHEANVLEDRRSLGSDKERARVLGPIALGALGVGVLALGAGGALSSMGFAGE